MQNPITQSDIDKLGVNVSEDNSTALLDALNEELDVRIGQEITEALNDDQLAEMVQLQQDGTAEQLSVWISQTISPEDLADIVQDERDILLGELASGEFVPVE